jgi:hypothetical protein
MFRGDEIFPLLERALVSLAPGARFLPPDAFGPIFGGDEHAVLDRLHDCASSVSMPSSVVSAVEAPAHPP